MKRDYGKGFWEHIHLSMERRIWIKSNDLKTSPPDTPSVRRKQSEHTNEAREPRGIRMSGGHSPNDHKLGKPTYSP